MKKLLTEEQILARRERCRRWIARHPERFKESQRKWHAANKEKQNERARIYQKTNAVEIRKRHANWYAVNKEAVADRRYQRLYGITRGEHNTLLANQGGVCPVCQSIPKQFVIDHDHETGDVRGLLCHRCNLGMGYFRDNAAALRSAAVYLEDRVIKARPRLVG